MRLSGWSPGRGLLRLLLGWVGLAVFAAAPGTPEAADTAWAVAGGLVLLATVAAALELAGPAPVALRREVAESLPLGRWSPVLLELRPSEATERRVGRRRLEVVDHPPPGAETEDLRRVVRWGPEGDEALRISYRLRPRRRGRTRFEPAEVWLASRLDLLRRRFRVGERLPVRVLPDFRPILAHGLAGIEERMAHLGFHLQRRRGEGLEFQELRDYREGDTLRHVDWKATARRGRLIARQYQEERNQQVILLLDCGRRMHAREGDLTHFDHVLDATLLLGWVAHRQGDAIGMQAFAGEDRWLPPSRGAHAVTRLLESIYDLQTTGESPDYAAAAARFMERQQRRSLVLLMTNLRDEDADELLPALRALRRRHLVVVSSIRELALTALRDGPVDDLRSALATAAAHRYLEARRRAHERVRSTGAFLLDVEPPRLPHELVARYLEIKRAGQL